MVDAVEAQAGFGAHRGQVARGSGRRAGEVAGQFVDGVAPVHLGNRVAAELIDFVAQVGAGVEALAFDGVATGEIDVFAVDPGAHAAPVVGGEGGKADLRQAPEGIVLRGQVERDGLVVLDQTGERVTARRLIGEPQAAVEVCEGGQVEPAAQVFEIALVADLGKARINGQSVVDQAFVSPVDKTARAPGAAITGVVGQGFVAQRPATVAEQVAAVADHLQTPAGHDARRDRGIVVRAQVQVHRPAQVDAGVVRLTEGGKQQPGAAPVIDRKLKVRQVQHRHIGEADDGAARGAEAFIHIEVDLAGVESPGLGLGRARGVAPTVELDAPGVVELEHLGPATGVLLTQRELGAEKRAGLVHQIEPRRFTGEHQVGTAEQRAIGHGHAIALGIERQPRRHQHIVPFAQFHIAADLGVAAVDQFQQVAGDVQVAAVAQLGRIVGHGERPAFARRPAGRRHRQNGHREQAKHSGAQGGRSQAEGHQRGVLGWRGGAWQDVAGDGRADQAPRSGVR